MRQPHEWPEPPGPGQGPTSVLTWGHSFWRSLLSALLGLRTYHDVGAVLAVAVLAVKVVSLEGEGGCAACASVCMPHSACPEVACRPR
jgi:hypothetical protein